MTLRRAVMGALTLPITDPNWANVVALLHFDGVNGSTSFNDETGKIWTPVGNAQISTAQSQFGGASGLFDASGDYLNCSDPAFSGLLTTSRWTIETWLRLNFLSGAVVPFSMGDSTTSYLQFMVDASLGLRMNKYGSDLLTQGNTSGLAAGQWMHIAFCRQDANLYGFIDGVLRAQSTNGASAPSITSTQFRVGANKIPAGFINGNLDELRVSKGVARYTTSFAIPDSPFPTGA